MKFSRRLLPPVFFLLLIVSTCGVTWWILLTRATASTKAAAPSPATIAKPIKEDQLNTITLTEDAVKNLALQTAVVERKTLPRTRVYGGEVIVLVGKSVIVSAPVSGMLRSVPDAMPRMGASVAKGKVLFELLPLVTPEGRANLASAKIDAESQVKSTETQLAAARIALDRAKKLLAGEAGSKRAVDEAQSLYDLAAKAVDAAKARLAVLQTVTARIEDGTAAPIPITAPEDGYLRTVSAMNGQNIPSGAALFEVVNLDHVWIRVPVYVGDMTEIDAAGGAKVGNLSARPGGFSRSARSVAAPPSANAAMGTVDLYYELDNEDQGLRPGERVGVSLPLATQLNSLTVPWSAVIHDIHGGTWVYEATGAREFVRRRVIARYVLGEIAVLAAGPEAGKQVVTAGAAELFGTETGFSK